MKPLLLILGFLFLILGSFTEIGTLIYFAYNLIQGVGLLSAIWSALLLFLSGLTAIGSGLILITLSRG